MHIEGGGGPYSILQNHDKCRLKTNMPKSVSQGD